MKDTIIELEDIMNEFSKRLAAISDDDFSAKPSAKKWSKKEVLGHLIDSGQNNLRRFICGQYEPVAPKIIYDQDFWVQANNYLNFKKENLINLWHLINMQIAFVLKQMPAGNYHKVVETSGTHTLEWLAVDYVKHLKHHINQIFPNAFNIVYP